MTRYVSRDAYETALADPNSFENQMSGNQSSVSLSQAPMFKGIGSLDQFKRLLVPILENIERQNKMEFVEKIDPYVQQVEQLTQQTFPNIDFNKSNVFGGGPAVDFMTPNMGGENQLGVPMGNPLQNLNTTPSPERLGSINTSPFGNFLRGGLGSIM